MGTPRPLNAADIASALRQTNSRSVHAALLEARVGAELIGKPMLVYFIDMAIEEADATLSREETLPQNGEYPKIVELDYSLPKAHLRVR